MLSLARTRPKRRFRRPSTKRNRAAQSNGAQKNKHYFVDTNIVTQASKKNDPAFNAFVDNPLVSFYYSDTVLQELRAWEETSKRKDIPVVPIHPKFQYIAAKDLKVGVKESAVRDLVARLPSAMTTSYLQRFKSDLFIVFESGFVCWDVMPDELEDEAPVLLTNNLKFYRKFIQNPGRKKMLEEVIGINGMEHLIDVKIVPELEDELGVKFRFDE